MKKLILYIIFVLPLSAETKVSPVQVKNFKQTNFYGGKGIKLSQIKIKPIERRLKYFCQFSKHTNEFFCFQLAPEGGN
jgi:hypothetical protein